MSCWGISFFGKDLCRFRCGDGTVDLSGEAFGLPPKTVRAMLAFSIVSVTFFTLVGAATVFAIYKEYKLMMAVVTAMINICSAILGYYFGSRGSSPPKENATLNTSLRENVEETDA
jgi:hypothetical protein